MREDPWRRLGREAVYDAFAAQRIGTDEATRALIAMGLEQRRRRRGQYPFPRAWRSAAEAGTSAPHSYH